MDNWLAICIIVIAVLVIVGNLSTVQKNSKQKLRKKGLNDLEETLPRSNKTDHKMPPIQKHKS